MNGTSYLVMRSDGASQSNSHSCTGLPDLLSLMHAHLLVFVVLRPAIGLDSHLPQEEMDSKLPGQDKVLPLLNNTGSLQM